MRMPNRAMPPKSRISKPTMIAAVGGKLLGIRLAGRVLGWTAHDCKIIGWLLQTKVLIT